MLPHQQPNHVPGAFIPLSSKERAAFDEVELDKAVQDKDVLVMARLLRRSKLTQGAVASIFSAVDTKFLTEPDQKAALHSYVNAGMDVMTIFRVMEFFSTDDQLVLAGSRLIGRHNILLTTPLSVDRSAIVNFALKQIATCIHHAEITAALVDLCRMYVNAVKVNDAAAQRILSTMAYWSHNATVSLACVRLFQEATLENRAVLLKGIDGSEAVMNTVFHFSADEAIAQSALKMLCITPKLLLYNHIRHGRMCGVKFVKSVLETHASNATLISEAFRLLDHLQDQAILFFQEEYDLRSLVLELARKFLDDATVSQWSVGAIKQMCRVGMEGAKSREVLGNFGACEFIFQVLQKHYPSNPMVCMRTFAAIERLCRDHTVNQNRLMACGIGPLLMEMWDKEEVWNGISLAPGGHDVARVGICGCIDVLCDNNAPIQAELAQLGACEKLLEYVRLGRKVVCWPGAAALFPSNQTRMRNAISYVDLVRAFKNSGKEWSTIKAVAIISGDPIASRRLRDCDLTIQDVLACRFPDLDDVERVEEDVFDFSEGTDCLLHAFYAMANLIAYAEFANEVVPVESMVRLLKVLHLAVKKSQVRRDSRIVEAACVLFANLSVNRSMQEDRGGLLSGACMTLQELIRAHRTNHRVVVYGWKAVANLAKTQTGKVVMRQLHMFPDIVQVMQLRLLHQTAENPQERRLMDEVLLHGCVAIINLTAKSLENKISFVELSTATLLSELLQSRQGRSLEPHETVLVARATQALSMLLATQPVIGADPLRCYGPKMMTLAEETSLDDGTRTLLRKVYETIRNTPCAVVASV